MNNEEKILDILASMHSRFDSMDQRFDAMDQRFNAMDQRFDSVDQRFDAMDQRMDAMDNSILKINIKLETDIEVRLDALAEGHAAILESLVPRSRVDDLEAEVRFLKTIVRQMSEDIHLLKKAQ